MSREASSSIKQRCPQYDLPVHCRGMDADGLPAGSCFLHVERHPVEMIISGYNYHKEGVEAWSTTGFDSTQSLQEHEWLLHYHSQAASVALASRKQSTFGHLLPDASPKESYSGYLQRIDVRSGLLAEYVRAAQHGLPDMLKVHLAMSSHPCSTNPCLGSTSGDLSSCRDAWWRAFEPHMFGTRSLFVCFVQHS